MADIFIDPFIQYVFMQRALAGARRFVDGLDDREIAAAQFSRDARLAAFAHAQREIIHLQRLLLHGNRELQRSLAGLDHRARIGERLLLELDPALARRVLGQSDAHPHGGILGFHEGGLEQLGAAGAGGMSQKQGVCH